MNNRKKQEKVDISKLNSEQAEKISEQIGKSIAVILDSANNKSANLLKSLGLQTAIKPTYMPLGAEKLENIKKNRAKDRPHMEIEVSRVMQEASDKCNELLGIYQMQVKLEYDIRPIEKTT